MPTPRKTATTAAKPTRPRASKKKPTPASAKASKRPARTVPARSPLAGLTVEEWMTAKVTGWQVHAIHALVELMREAAPLAEPHIKWGQPVFVSNGPFAFIKPAKNHVTLGFWRGADLKDSKGLLEGDGVRMKHLKIPAPGTFDGPALTAFVKQAVALNAAKGDPTK